MRNSSFARTMRDNASASDAVVRGYLIWEICESEISTHAVRISTTRDSF